MARVIVTLYRKYDSLGIEHPRRRVSVHDILHSRPGGNTQCPVELPYRLICVCMLLSEGEQRVAVEHPHVFISSARPKFTIAPATAPCRVRCGLVESEHLLGGYSALPRAEYSVLPNWEEATHRGRITLLGMQPGGIGETGWPHVCRGVEA